MRRSEWHRLVFGALLLTAAAAFAGQADEPGSSATPPAPPSQVIPPAPPAACAAPSDPLQPPVLVEGPAPSQLPPAQLEGTDRPLPINLTTSLRLAGARPVIIAAAQASLEVAAAELAQARSLWLPSVYGGAGYYRHDGATQGQSGNFYRNSKDQFLAGGGLKAFVSATDALFAPLAARQVRRAREIDVQVARNEALLAVAQAYFNVQRARGQLAGAQDVVDKGHALAEKVKGLRLGLVAPADASRARALLANYEEAVASDREAWRIASADLTQVLRLDPAAVVVPLEPPDVRVTIISPQAPVDALIPIGLTNRPELASQQALVQAALARIRQERARPLVPSLVVEGGPGPSGPGGYFMAGEFASGAHGQGNPTMPRDDVSVGLVWGLNNLGCGNRALVRERRAEQQQMAVELCRLQDQVAGDVARAHAQLQSATTRIGQTETGLVEAQAAYAASLKGLGQVIQVGEAKVQLERTLDVISSIQSLARAYDSYFGSVNDYNIAQFRLFRALGYPADLLACAPLPGELLPVDPNRPPQIAPVCGPDAPGAPPSAPTPSSSSRPTPRGGGR
jgi:outer membrane protein TolC